MIRIDITSSKGSSFYDLVNVVRFIVRNDGSDNLRQALAVIRSYQSNDFTESQKSTVKKIKENIDVLLRDLTVHEMTIKDRMSFLHSILPS